MQDNQDKNIRLVVGGFECDEWDNVTVDSQIDVAADGWGLNVFNSEGGGLPDSIKAGAVAQLYIDNQLVLTGIIDNFGEIIGRAGIAISISGRDFGGQFLDCSAALFNAKSVNFEQFLKDKEVSKYIPLEELKLDIDPDLATLNKESITIEPGESLWDSLVKLAATAGQWIWFNPDGVLRIGNPFNTDVNINLNLMRNGQGNSILNADYQEDVSGVFNELRILGQDNNATQFLGEAQVKTPYTFPRLKIISMSDIDNQSDVQAILNKVIHDNNLQAYTLTAIVPGWTITGGKAWEPGWQVTINSDVSKRINAKWVVMGRTFKLSRSDGKTTVLKLKRMGDWAQPLLYKDKPQQDDGMNFGADGRGTYTGASQ